MNQSQSGEENQYIQRFDTPIIQDFDFPKESGDQPMPYQQTGPVASRAPESVAKTEEQAAAQQVPASRPIATPQPEQPSELFSQPEKPEPQAADPVMNLPPVIPRDPPMELVKLMAQAAEQTGDSRYDLKAWPKNHTDKYAVLLPGAMPLPGAMHSPEAVKKLNPKLIPKFENQLVKPPVYCGHPSCGDDETALYVIDISEFKQQILPQGFPETTVWGYGGNVRDPNTCQVKYFRNAPGATFETIRNVPIRVKWINNLKGPHLFAVDPTLHWANPNDMPMTPPKPWPQFPPGFPDAQSPVPIVTHLHGGEVPSVFDGHPDAWFTYDGEKGPAYHTSLYTYPNSQEAATLWYHDHALGITRLNVYAGLAGFYLLRSGEEFGWQRESILPKGQYEIPIVIQDRSFNTDGSLSFTNAGVNPDIHPYWDPEFFGDAIMVNGKVWPNLDVERRQYRFRLLNGSNARFYNLRMSNGMKFTQIGTDGGFLPEPIALDTLLLAPAERADILVDFSGIIPGTKIIMTNDAAAPFPDGEAPEADTVGRIMQFTIPRTSPEAVKPKKLPERLNIIPALISDSPQRILTLNEVQGPNGPIIILLNGQKWESPVSELPRVGATEDWVIVNLTMDTHPIHLHLVQFLLMNRQDFESDEYNAKWLKLNGTPPLSHPTVDLPIERYLIGAPIAPDKNETGWKDTVRMNPMQVTRIRVRFAPQRVPVRISRPGVNFYPFEPSIGAGYLWHCHILDHEDNDMMRPFQLRYL